PDRSNHLFQGLGAFTEVGHELGEVAQAYVGDVVDRGHEQFRLGTEVVQEGAPGHPRLVLDPLCCRAGITMGHQATDRGIAEGLVGSCALVLTCEATHAPHPVQGGGWGAPSRNAAVPPGFSAGPLSTTSRPRPSTVTALAVDRR